MLNLDDYSLGENNELLRLTSRVDCKLVTNNLVQQASHGLSIFSHDLEPELYSSTALVDDIRTLLAKTSYAKVRILVYDVERMAQRGHRILDLSRRQPSRVVIRKLSHAYHHAFLVADETAVIDRRRAERYEATANFNDPGWAMDLLRFFDGIWEKSQAHAFSI